MKVLLGLVAIAVLGSCAPDEPLVVKTFQLRNARPGDSDDYMVRHEKQRRLYGAVTLDERAARLGQYYTLVWQDPEGVGQGEVELIFEYQQGASASRVKRMVQAFPASDASGKAEFSVIGKNHSEGGRVLTWKATLKRGGRVIATKQSYLWE